MFTKNTEFPLSVIFRQYPPQHFSKVLHFYEGHPAAPLAKKLTHTCRLFQVPHKLLNVKSADLPQINSFPYLLFFNHTHGEKAVLVHACENGRLSIEMDGRKSQLPVFETEPFRSSVHLLLFKAADSNISFTFGRPSAPPGLFRLSAWVLALLFSFLVIRSFQFPLSVWHALLSISIVGVAAALLTQYQKSETLSGIASFFCGTGSETGCNAVQQKDFLRPLGFSISGAAIAFFSTVIITLCLAGPAGGQNRWLLYLHLAGCAGVAAAWIYQLRVIRAFCILCFIIGMLVILNTVCLFMLYPGIADAEALTVLLVAGCIGLLLALLLHNVSALKESGARSQKRLEFVLFGAGSRNTGNTLPNTYDAKQLPAQISLSPEYAGDLPGLHAILDLHCHYCKNAFRQLLYLSNFTKVNMSFIYDRQNMAAEAVFQRLMLHKPYNRSETGQLEKMLFQQLPQTDTMPEYNETVMQLFQFIQRQEGGQLPLFIIDNIVLSPAYTAEDLIYLLPA
jgi:uncharacterized membrane protein